MVLWTKAALLKAMGQRKFTVGNIPYPKIFGVPTEELSVTDYVRRMAEEHTGPPLYVFHGITSPGR